MRIDRKTLNIVIPISRESDAEGNSSPALYVHSSPVAREVFEANFAVMSQAFSWIQSQGIGGVTGARIAHLVVRQVAEAAGKWEGRTGVKAALMEEIRRLSNVVTPGPNGWVTLPLGNAIEEGLIDDDEASEVEGQIVFFILASAIYRKQDLPKILAAIFIGYWGSLIVSSNSTEFAASLGGRAIAEMSTDSPASLPISTATETSPPRVRASSIPH